LTPRGWVDWIEPSGTVMADRSIFISSCSRRQLARRRPAGLVTRGRRTGRMTWRQLRPRVPGSPLALAALGLSAALAGALVGAGVL
jgi:hypothetical protein